MRIRRRPPPPLSPSQNTNSSLQFQPPNTREERELHPDGDLSVASSDPHPKQVFKQEEFSSSSYKKTLDAQQHSNERIGEDMERNIASSTTTNEILNNSTSISTTSGYNLREEVNIGKKRRPPSVLVEGSRCSRVNGRGWRCSQQTLIGYSLCEHHLGKGKLRSISNVRVGTQGKSSRTRKPKKKESKIGIVKARSISCLLDEDDHAMASAERAIRL